MPKIIFLYNNSERIVTGGQKYEDMLFRTLCSQPGFEVRRMWLGRSKGRVSKYTHGLRNLRLIKMLRHYDLILLNSVESLAFMILARVMSRMFGKRIGIIHHHFLYEGQTGFRRGYYKWLECSYLRSATHIIVPSPFILDKCRTVFPGRKIVYWQIPFAPPVHEALSPRAGDLLYIGTIEPRKGLELLVGAMAVLKARGIGCRLRLIGKTVDVDYRRALEERVAGTGVDVGFMGYVSKEIKDDVTAQSDIFAFPSRQEGYGMALCEAMAFGLPVVCFDNSAMPYTVRTGVNGILVADGDAVGLADALGSIINDRTLRARLSQGALQTASSLMTPERFARTVRDDVMKIVQGL